MTKILISGAAGTMGRVVASQAAAFGCEVVAGVDRMEREPLPFPTYRSFSECSERPDVIIDFSHPSVLTELLEYAVGEKLPVVVATTGMSPGQIEEIERASEKTPVFFSFNMSLGVNLLTELARKAASVLGDNFDIEIIEKHHNQKIDAPSGTAIMIADAVSQATSYKPEYVYDRHSVRQKRRKNEIGMHSIRGGTIVGEHEVLFAGQDECVTITHSASSKKTFAVGAYRAALFLLGKGPGLYNMNDMIK